MQDWCSRLVSSGLAVLGGPCVLRGIPWGAVAGGAMRGVGAIWVAAGLILIQAQTQTQTQTLPDSGSREAQRIREAWSASQLALSGGVNFATGGKSADSKAAPAGTPADRQGTASPQGATPLTGGGWRMGSAPARGCRWRRMTMAGSTQPGARGRISHGDCRSVRLRHPLSYMPQACHPPHGSFPSSIPQAGACELCLVRYGRTS